ncbi:S-adenosylmethionine decarboxylase family protein [Pseudoflavitalea rhizosphaerae]|uniref:S-adenosylmethionine decarboxylase family protein n=1 Tax=Pseudoflavitalea rhizosphaerae TaxID=1884793 RepID=UPI000F8EA909|nr:S-adenosylmethionine decarboxylase [Pseudoflavitalea rhizosphaerae]
MSYQPGKHLIATLSTDEPILINNYASFRILVDALIQQYQLQKLGEVYHDFSPAGFTAVICLSESHLSIHTWPEYGLINLDIYLSNFKRNNEDAVMGIYQTLEKHFAAKVLQQQIITR